MQIYCTYRDYFVMGMTNRTQAEFAHPLLFLRVHVYTLIRTQYISWKRIY